jgi:3-keto-disaccharide hydrolase
MPFFSVRGEALLRVALTAAGLSLCWPVSATDVAAAQPFLGRWDLTLHAPDREYPSWLEVTLRDSRLTVVMVGRWGSARELPSAEIKDNHIRFVSPKAEEGRETDMIFEGEISGQRLAGTTSGPDGTPWSWRGERAPALKRAHTPQWSAPLVLFNGRDLTGWRLSDPGAHARWRVVDDVLVSPGQGPDLITDAVFEDFKLHIEFNCAAQANSGIYLRGRYEVQIENDAQPEGANQRTGAVYGFLAPSPPAPRVPGEWQTYDITLIGRTVTVVLNGQTIIDRQDIPGLTGGALDSHEARPGPIYLQGSEMGQVSFRNIIITRARGS